MPPRRSKMTKHSSSRVSNSRSRGNAGSRPATSGPVTLKQLVTISLLPVWLVVIAAFDQAIADYHNQTIPIDVSRLRQEPDFDKIDDALRTHWVSTDQEGNLYGRISEIDDELSAITPLGDLEIVLLQQGKVQYKADATDPNGLFKLIDVQPGEYTLVAAGPNGFMAYAVHVLTPLVPFDPDETGKKLRQIQKSQYVSLADFDPVVTGQDQFQIDAAAIPPQFRELKRIVSGYLPTDAALSLGKNMDELQPLEEALKIAGGFKFALNDDGSFSGRVSNG